MNMLTKNLISFLTAFLFIFACFSPYDIQAQQKKSKKKTEIEVPDEALEPILTDKAVKERIKKMTEWVTAKFSSELKDTKVFLADPDPVDEEETDDENASSGKKAKRKKSKKDKPEQTGEEKKVKGRDIHFTYSDFRRNFVGFELLLYSQETMDDLMEVTKHDLSWYLKTKKICEQIAAKMRQIDRARITGDDPTYKAYVNEFRKIQDAYKEHLKDKPQRLSSETLKKIVEKNKARRRAKYIADYKAKKLAEAEEAAKDNQNKSGKGKR